MEEYTWNFARFTAPYHTTKTVFMSEQGGELPKFRAFTFPFSSGVWMFCLCFTLVATVVSKYISSSKQSLFDIFLHLIGSMLKQPLVVEGRNTAKKFWWITWLVWAGLVSFLYSTFFLSFLMLPTKEQSPKNFQELSEAVQNKKFKCVVDPYVCDLMLESSEDHLRLLAEVIAKNEWYYIGGLPPISKTDCWIYMYELMEIAYYPPNQIKHFSEDSLYVNHRVVYVGKSFCCSEQLNRVLLNFVEGGFVQKHFSEALRFYVWKNELERLSWMDDKTHALSMEEMKYPFYLLLFCYALCIIVFLFEIFIPKHNRLLKIFSNKSVLK
ncbi:hypothetical protein JTE90_014397 [Oedothorax gibbosus]|uniref:Ionotropic glutamate receptor C-terminal domain-containing protein n=1 Tax=Oedothorax gibbosus TaxID=931172 RepID=A0AAV6V5C8_9ARAC|nr:hypothetical protein JTE90_014397 [Oedothorax gibbosus]